MSDPGTRLLIAAVALVFAGLIVIVMPSSHERRYWRWVGLGLMLAGAVIVLNYFVPMLPSPGGAS